jgi:predicted RNase H-like nuclease (RuvC/YqgF family)
MENFKNELPDLKGYCKESQEKYIENMTKRKESLLEATEKLNEKITGQQKKNLSLDDRLEQAKKKLAEKKPQEKEYTQELKHSHGR